MTTVHIRMCLVHNFTELTKTLNTGPFVKKAFLIKVIRFLYEVELERI